MTFKNLTQFDFPISPQNGVNHQRNIDLISFSKGTKKILNLEILFLADSYYDFQFKKSHFFHAHPQCFRFE